MAIHFLPYFLQAWATKIENRLFKSIVEPKDLKTDQQAQAYFKKPSSEKSIDSLEERIIPIAHVVNPETRQSMYKTILTEKPPFDGNSSTILSQKYLEKMKITFLLLYNQIKIGRQ